MSGAGVLQSLTADGQTPETTVYGPIMWKPSGSFGGGTAKLQELAPGDVWKDVPSVSSAVAANVLVEYPLGVRNVIRTDLSGATTPAFDAWVQHQGQV